MEIQERDADSAVCIIVNVMAPLASVMFVVPDCVATDLDQLSAGKEPISFSFCTTFTLLSGRRIFQRLFRRESQVVEKAPYDVVAVYHWIVGHTPWCFSRTELANLV